MLGDFFPPFWPEGVRTAVAAEQGAAQSVLVLRAPTWCQWGARKLGSAACGTGAGGEGSKRGPCSHGFTSST